MIFDEIHHDLIVGKKPFVSGLSIRDGYYRDNLVVLDSTSKTFNMAAFDNSHAESADHEEVRSFCRNAENAEWKSAWKSCRGSRLPER